MLLKKKVDVGSNNGGSCGVCGWFAQFLNWWWRRVRLALVEKILGGGDGD